MEAKAETGKEKAGKDFARFPRFIR